MVVVEQMNADFSALNTCFMVLWIPWVEDSGRGWLLLPVVVRSLCHMHLVTELVWSVQEGFAAMPHALAGMAGRLSSVLTADRTI